jgi:mannose-6-phosphate isomerase-like protein (cupin superfamily)
MHPRSILLIVLAALAVAAAATAGNPARIVVAGDHVAVNHATARPPRMGWGQALERFVDVPVIALSAGERERASLSGVAPRSSLDEIAAGDLVLIQFVAPDAPTAAADDAALAGLRQLIASARAAGAHPLLVTPAAQRVFDGGGHAPDTHAAIAAALRALAAQERIELVELGQRSRDWLEALGPVAAQAWYFHDPATGYVDDEDLDQRGAASVACLVAADLVAQRLIAPSQLKRDVECGGVVDHSSRDWRQTRPSLIEHADAIAEVQAAPHGGDGLTVAAPFFKNAPDLGIVARRRTLHDGASIGVHAHGKDEIYYVLSGRGELTLDGKAYPVGPGNAILTRDGSSHSLRQIGADDLVILIVYAGES